MTFGMMDDLDDLSNKTIVFNSPLYDRVQNILKLHHCILYLHRRFSFTEFAINISNTNIFAV